jgi:hypothetical protein
MAAASGTKFEIPYESWQQEGRTAASSPASRLARRFLNPIARLLKTGDPHATVDRLFTSQHVKDLQLIIGFAALLVFCTGIALLLDSAITTQNWSAVPGKLFTVFAPVLAVFGAVLAWAYQVGSARLGVVDLFACEISTLCRVTTIVDTVRRYVDKFEQGPVAEPTSARGAHIPVGSHTSAAQQQFTSQENYFPVFESCTRDLQTLEARVVINITAFYTFMKTVRDSMRMQAQIGPQPADLKLQSQKAPAAGPGHEATRNLVYLMFLGLESARHALGELVEFQPENAERAIVVLISELEAYRFLRGQFRDEKDTHHQRLLLRDADYRHVVPELRRAVEAGRSSEKNGTESHELQLWEPAWRLLPELDRRYQDAVLNCDGNQKRVFRTAS